MEFYPQLPISHLDRRESSKMGFFHVLAVRFGALQGWEVEPVREGEVDGPVLFGQGNCGAGSVTNVSAEGPSDLSPLSVTSTGSGQLWLFLSLPGTQDSSFSTLTMTNNSLKCH